MRKFGLIGYPLGHSFSAKYFAEKFRAEGISDCRYDNYPIDNVSKFPAEIDGFNVTIPYKELIITHLDTLSEEAAQIGAVNCVCNRGGILTGYNTDAYGFETALLELIATSRPKALVLGTGGAAKAVCYVLRKLGIPYIIVSRTATDGRITYDDLSPETIAANRLIINTTPLGTYPKTEAKPDIPYSAIGPRHMLFDLVYNPSETAFLREGRLRGASIKNGYRMLVMQAEKAWEIWNIM